MISGSPLALRTRAALAPLSIESCVTLSSRSPPVVMNTVRLFVSSVANGDVGVPRAFAVAPQAASLRDRPTCAHAVASALR